jgi:XapX domain-containing protein
MKPYLLSLAAGLLVGVVYSLLGVRSPAPPAVALLGLLGTLLGEQAVPLAKRLSQTSSTMSRTRASSGNTPYPLQGEHSSGTEKVVR